MTYAKPGRASVKVRVAHVEDTRCPESDGNHELTNAWAVTRCRFCLQDWPTLDAEIRRGAA